MCDMTNDCDCKEVNIASSGKNVEFFCDETEDYFCYQGRMIVDVCAECGTPDWRTIR